MDIGKKLEVQNIIKPLAKMADDLTKLMAQRSTMIEVNNTKIAALQDEKQKNQKAVDHASKIQAKLQEFFDLAD